MREQKNKLVIILILISYYIKSQTFYDKAYKEYQMGNDQVAINLFDKSIQNNENIAKSYLYRGVSKTYIGKYFEAMSDIKASINIDSNYYKSYFFYGRIYFAQGFFSTAIKYYDISIRKNARDADVYDDRAMANVQEGKYMEAIKDEDIAISINKNKSDYFNNRGYAKIQIKDYQSAIKDFDIAIKIGDSPRAYANKGTALASLGNHQEAIMCFTIGIEKMPKAIDMNYLRGLSYKALGKNEQACKDFNKSAEMKYEPAISEFKKTCQK